MRDEQREMKGQIQHTVQRSVSLASAQPQKTFKKCFAVEIAMTNVANIQ